MKPERGQIWTHEISGLVIKIWSVIDRVTPKLCRQTYDVWPWDGKRMSQKSWESWSKRAKITQTEAE